MSAHSGAPWLRGYGGRGRGYAQSELRVSDAERAEVADRLSKHFADGRLDQQEFNERLDRAMRAKTGADLGGLFVDLPAVETRTVATRQSRVRPRHSRFLILVVLVAVAASVGQRLVVDNLGWVVVVLLVLLVLRYGSWRRRS